MIFKDRHEAGKKLVSILETYRDDIDAVVLGLPRGGIVTAYTVAKGLNLPLDIICPMKIGAPSNPEYAIGAVTETGEGILNTSEIEWLEIPKSYLDDTIEKEKDEAKLWLKKFREGRMPIPLVGRTVIVIDDGMATGLTMQAAIASLRKSNVAKVVVAIPVAPQESLEKIRSMADEIFCLSTPLDFQAVSHFYQHFDQTSTEEVAEMLKKS